MQDAAAMMMLAPVLTPHGVLTLVRTREADEALVLELERGVAAGAGVCARARARAVVPGRRRGRHDSASGAVVLAGVRGALRDRAVRLPGIGERSKPPVPIPADGELDTMAAAVPPMTGAEYLTTEVLADLWRGMDAGLRCRIGSSQRSPCRSSSRAVIRPGTWSGACISTLRRIRKDEDAPFAFLATYTTRLSAEAKAQHLPLGKALQEYAGARNRERLLSLLMPVQRAAEHCPWLKAMVDGGEIFHPLRWSPQQALQFLKDVPALERRRRGRADAGELAHEPPRAPAGEGNGRRQAAVAAGDGRAARLPDGGDARRRKSLAAEIKRLLAQSDGLVVDSRQVGRGRSRSTEPDARAIRGDRASRGQRRPVVRRGDAHAGRSRHCDGDGAAGQSDVDWSQTVAGPWLAETLAALAPSRWACARRPWPVAPGYVAALSAGWRAMALSARTAPARGLPCRRHGARQDHPGVVAAAGAEERRRRAERKPCLLVAPASLLANWAAEIARFAPSLNAVVAHPSAMPAEKLAKVGPRRSGGCRSGHHELRLSGSHSVARRQRLATGGA